MKFKVGDRVAVYGKCETEQGIAFSAERTKAIVVEIPMHTSLIKVQECEVRGFITETLWVHPKQCRRLIKKVRRQIWLFKDDLSPDCTNKYVRFHYDPHPIIKEHWIKFREVKD
jgi:hypothetical protein